MYSMIGNKTGLYQGRSRYGLETRQTSQILTDTPGSNHLLYTSSVRLRFIRRTNDETNCCRTIDKLIRCDNCSSFKMGVSYFDLRLRSGRLPFPDCKAINYNRDFDTLAKLLIYPPSLCHCVRLS